MDGAQKFRYLIVVAALISAPSAHATKNATGNGDWISVGVPTRMNVGSTGYFYLAGNDHGSCGGTAATYFRSNMSNAYWKELYALFILAQTNQRPLECIVESACGTAELWVSYCTLGF